ncbi:hypothetical protein [uncultured Amnibacterium sp.]|uniref:hypothetical protein n=1 Tax=uncultured Amnibacterium sp. TaxID=1631851 RepID=UPI0035C98EA6
MREQGTLLDAVGRAKHPLAGTRGGEAAGVTVHGECPISGCSEMNVFTVHTDTTTVRCAGCGTAFDV